MGDPHRTLRRIGGARTGAARRIPVKVLKHCPLRPAGISLAARVSI